MDQTINLNASHCIQKAGNIGSNLFTNICSGKTTVVPWGSADWLGAIVIGGLMLSLTCLILFFAVMMWRTARDW